MIEFSFLGKSYQTDRIIGDVDSPEPGPTIVFIGGMHGNEPSGVVALKQVFEQLESRPLPFRGRIIGLAGNMVALAQNRRFLEEDLNRIWNQDFALQRNRPPSTYLDPSPEQQERRELFEIIKPLLESDQPLYFIDLHTTSAPSVPFIAINDQLENRHFGEQFPVPKVLGIEEYLEGPLLSYLNDFGHIALAFEAGQHDDPESVKLHVSFVFLALRAAGIVSTDGNPDWVHHAERLKNSSRDHQGFFEIVYRQPVKASDAFRMTPGFHNFSTIRAGETLAHDCRGEIPSPRNGQIFMPLYQESGTDGFFVVRTVPQWALRLSSVLRRINLERILTLLPGVSRSSVHSDALIVNRKIAAFFATEIFHLLGYRRKRQDGKNLMFLRREIGP